MRRSLLAWGLGLALALPLPLPAAILDFVQAFARGPSHLDAPQAVAISPDGAHAYYASAAADAVVVFGRDAIAGTLNYLGAARDGIAGAAGLSGARDVLVSPDGAFLYVAGAGENAIAVFSRDAATGALAFVEMEQDGVAGVDGLSGVAALALAPGGAHLYAASPGEDAVAVFARDAVTGELAFVEVERDGIAGVDGIDGASALLVSPAPGNHVYVTGAVDDAVAVFGRNPATGALAFLEVQRDGVGGFDALNGAADLALAATGGHLYVAGAADGAIAELGRNPATGHLSYLGAVATGNAVHGLVLPVDGNALYAVGAAAATIQVFQRNLGTGLLTPLPPAGGEFSGGPGLAVSPDGSFVYLASAAADVAAAFRRLPPQGLLALADREENGVGYASLLRAEGVTVSADGENVYATGADSNSLVAFARAPATGSLTEAAVYVDGIGAADGLAGAAGVATSPDGAHLYVAGSDEGSLAAYERLAAGGLALIEVERDGAGGVAGLAGALGVAISPDGAHVYASGPGDDAVAVFARDTESGALTWVQVQVDGVAGVDGLAGALWVALSPDGAHLYVSGPADNGVAVFARNATTGALTFVEAELDGVGGVENMIGAAGIAVAPDGAHVYVSALLTGAVLVFARDPVSGALTYASQVQADLGGGGPGFGRAGALALSPDGRLLFVCIPADDAVVAFRRDAASGALTFLERVRDGDLGADGLAGAVIPALDPAGLNLYVAGAEDDGLAVFEVFPEGYLFRDDFESGDDSAWSLSSP
ncbi:MAG: beta-propeller fold lactonase family protein [Thermoanaerobaculia bacterium]